MMCIPRLDSHRHQAGLRELGMRWHGLSSTQPLMLACALGKGVTSLAARHQSAPSSSEDISPAIEPVTLPFYGSLWFIPCRFPKPFLMLASPRNDLVV